MNGQHSPSQVARFAMAMAVAWSSFLSAGVLEALVFSVVDPHELRWFGITPVEMPVQAVYTVSFLILWSVVALGASLALLLVTQRDEVRRPQPRSPGWPR